MNYKFPLESVLNYKKTLEQKQAQELGKIQARLIEAEKVLEDQSEQKNRASEELAAKERQGLGQREITLFRNFIDGAQRDMDEQKKTINNIKDMLEKKRRELVAAAREKKVVEKLKEKGEVRFLQELRRRETKEVDDLSSIRFGNRKDENV